MQRDRSKIVQPYSVGGIFKLHGTICESIYHSRFKMCSTNSKQHYIHKSFEHGIKIRYMQNKQIKKMIFWDLLTKSSYGSILRMKFTSPKCHLRSRSTSAFRPGKRHPKILDLVAWLIFSCKNGWNWWIWWAFNQLRLDVWGCLAEGNLTVQARIAQQLLEKFLGRQKNTARRRSFFLKWFVYICFTSREWWSLYWGVLTLVVYPTSDLLKNLL